MNQISLSILTIIVCLLSFTGQSINAQTSRVLVDVKTRQPVPYVNIYSKSNNSVLGTVSNEKGVFYVDFTFKTLLFSHINYELLEVSDIKDTVYLKPKTKLLTEIVVTNKQPKWISEKLKRVIDDKHKNYQIQDRIFAYNYQTYTLNDSNGYAFVSNGNILIPQLKKTDYKISAQKNIIKYKDKTAGVDFSNLQRMLYDNFIKNLDTKFIKNYTFNQNYSYTNTDKNIIQLMFISRKFDDDAGFLLIDTTNNVILEFERSSGTNFNISTHTKALLRNAAKSYAGFTYDTWITKTNTKYRKIGNSYYMSECKYKFYMKTTTKNKKVDKIYFASKESEVIFNENYISGNDNFSVLPAPYYIVPIMTKKMQKEEDKIKKVKVSYENF